jgi:hypothetical protein
MKYPIWTFVLIIVSVAIGTVLGNRLPNLFRRIKDELIKMYQENPNMFKRKK